jgi:hypothetical protein
MPYLSMRRKHIFVRATFVIGTVAQEVIAGGGSTKPRAATEARESIIAPQSVFPLYIHSGGDLVSDIGTEDRALDQRVPLVDDEGGGTASPRPAARAPRMAKISQRRRVREPMFVASLILTECLRRPVRTASLLRDKRVNHCRGDLGGRLRRRSPKGRGHRRRG